MVVKNIARNKQTWKLIFPYMRKFTSVYVNVECMAVIDSETSLRCTEVLEHSMLDASI